MAETVTLKAFQIRMNNSQTLAFWSVEWPMSPFFLIRPDLVEELDQELLCRQI